MVARALEEKGIIFDRCELNRQIKAANALFQGLKTAVKKLMIENKTKEWKTLITEKKTTPFYQFVVYNDLAK